MCLCTLLCWLACVCISRGVAFHSQCKQRVHHPSSFVWGNEGHAVKGRAPPPPPITPQHGEGPVGQEGHEFASFLGISPVFTKTSPSTLIKTQSNAIIHYCIQLHYFYYRQGKNGRNAISVLKGHYMQDFMLFLACLLLWYQLHSHFSGQMNHGLFTDLQHLQDACVVLPQSKTFS